MIFAILALISAIIASPLVPRHVPLHVKRQEYVVPGKYVIKFNDDISASDLQRVMSSVSNITEAEPDHIYDIGNFKGLAISASNDQLNLIRRLDTDLLHHIEQDSIVSISSIQLDPPWGLARISHRSPNSTTYGYDNSAGAGTYSYILDTGIRISHSEFGGRATWGANFANDGLDSDGSGHGTHVAGTTGGITYGVAKQTNLIAVKILDSQGNGNLSGIIAGVQWAVNDAISKNRIGKTVVNMSGATYFSAALNDAVSSAVNSGLFFSVASGNGGTDAAEFSPSSNPVACTVGATNSTDGRASWSNYGPFVDILAPGVGILSAIATNDTAIGTKSGTSMSTPHITGLGAYLLGLEGAMSPTALCSRLQDLATKDIITEVGLNSSNYLAFNGYTSY